MRRMKRLAEVRHLPSRIGQVADRDSSCRPVLLADRSTRSAAAVRFQPRAKYEIIIPRR